MKKRVKLIASVFSVVCAIILMGFGVYAATQVTGKVTSNVSFVSKDVKCTFEVSVAGGDFVADSAGSGVLEGAARNQTYSVNNENVGAAAPQKDFVMGNYTFNPTNESGKTITYTVKITNNGSNSIRVSYAETKMFQNIENIMQVTKTNLENADSIAPNASFTASIELKLLDASADISVQDLDIKFVVEKAGAVSEQIKDYMFSSPVNNEVTLTGFNGNSPNINIPSKDNKNNSIVGISTDAFKDNIFINSVSIPDSVKTIDENAFTNCQNLTKLTVPSSVTGLDILAVKDCPNLKTINYLGTMSQFKTINSNWSNANSDNEKSDVILLKTINCTDKEINWSGSAWSDSSLKATSIDIEFCIEIENGSLSYSYSLKGKNTSFNYTSPIKNQVNATTIYLSKNIYNTNDDYFLKADFDANFEIGAFGAINAYYQLYDGSTLVETTDSSSSISQFEKFSLPNSTGWSVKQGTDIKVLINISASWGPCFTSETMITLADGTAKRADQIGYDDLLLVWNFDEGKLDASYPVWIQESKVKSLLYYLVTFEDGSILRIIEGHRIYSVDNNIFIYGNLVGSVNQTAYRYLTDENGDLLLDLNGNPIRNDKKIISIQEIKEPEFAYNIITGHHFNLFANGYLTSNSFNNMYGAFNYNNGKMTYDMDKVNQKLSGGYGENGTLYAYEELDMDTIPYYLYISMRVAEQKGVRTIDEVNAYISKMMHSVKNFDINDNGNNIFRVSTSENFVKENVEKFEENANYVLPSAKGIMGKTFVGWRSSIDNRLYAEGEIAIIIAPTHFIAVYE